MSRKSGPGCWSSNGIRLNWKASGSRRTSRPRPIEVYRLRLAGVETLVNLYRTEMENARIRSDVEMKRIEAFRAKVDAFTARIGAKTAEFNLYQARIAGEQAKAEVYSRQVEAFGRQVDAAKTEADVRIAQAGAVLEADRQKIEKYRADIEMYDSEVKKAIRKADILAKIYNTDVGSYDAAIRAAVQQAELRVKNHAVQMDHETNQLEREAQRGRDQHERASGPTPDATQDDRGRERTWPLNIDRKRPECGQRFGADRVLELRRPQHHPIMTIRCP